MDEPFAVSTSSTSNRPDSSRVSMSRQQTSLDDLDADSFRAQLYHSHPKKMTRHFHPMYDCPMVQSIFERVSGADPSVRCRNGVDLVLDLVRLSLSSSSSSGHRIACGVRAAWFASWSSMSRWIASQDGDVFSSMCLKRECRLCLPLASRRKLRSSPSLVLGPKTRGPEQEGRV